MLQTPRCVSAQNVVRVCERLDSGQTSWKAAAVRQ